MDFAGVPLFLPGVWASSAVSPYINTPIPVPSQQGITNGLASFDDGFPPLTFVPFASGGAGPFGADFNGILNEVTAGLQWLEAGGGAVYNSVFQTAIGGYPKTAVVKSVAYPGTSYVSLVDNNISDPDTGGANWALAQGTGLAVFNTPGTYSFALPAANLKVTVIGGGGGGGASNNSTAGGSLLGNCGAGGGGGGFTYSYLTQQTIGTVVTITVGAGGTASANNPGGAGGSSSYDGSMTATGGGAGQFGSATIGIGGAGGTGSGGNLNITGGIGGSTGTNDSGSATQSEIQDIYNKGGIAAGGLSTITFQGTGSPGSGYGSGGSGASGGSGLAGGVGAPGIVIIEW
jgi:hypothetical protein